MQALRMIKGGNKFGLDEQIRSRQLSRMNKTLGSVGDLLGWEGESSDLVSQREDCREYRQCRTFLQATHPPILGPQATPHLSKCCAGNGHFPNGIRIHQLQLFSCGS